MHRRGTPAGPAHSSRPGSCFAVLDQPFLLLTLALPRMLAKIEAELATVRPADKTHLRQRAELVRSLFALS
jgi:hypothetical protein